MTKAEKVFVGLSGGVDSSVAAYLLKKAGFDVTGVYLRCYNLDGCSERDSEDARRVAEHLKIPFYVWDFEKEYKERVVEYMVDGYKNGLTPNPDVECNREVKFGLFLERALRVGADFVATGHYVRLQKEKQGGKIVHQLYAAEDKNKDQSYFLWTLTQKQLAHALFPLGDLEKPAVRKLALGAGLPTATKKDSQGICFLGMVGMEEFLKTRLPVVNGEVQTLTGEKIGEHEGAHFYTIGQRHGLNLSNKRQTKSLRREEEKKENMGAHYVVSKNVKTNTVTVAEGSDNPALFKKEMVLTGVVLASPLKSGTTLKVMARVRYRQPLSPATLAIKAKEKAALIFDTPQKFVAEGQSAVVYDAQGRMLGGGVIVSAS
jgi:tRNA-specific 2-thiouridylase